MKTFLALVVSSTATVLVGSAMLGACSDDPVATLDAAVPAPDAAADTSTAPTDGSAGDSASPGDGATPTSDASDAGESAAEKRLCDALTSRNQCFDGTGSAQTCEPEDKCFARLMLPAALDSYATCHGFPSCKGQDGCLETAGTVAGGQAATDYTTACMAKATECGAQFPDDEYCSAAAFVYRGIGAAAAACLSKPCADQKACFDAAIAPIAACKQL